MLEEPAGQVKSFEAGAQSQQQASESSQAAPSIGRRPDASMLPSMRSTIQLPHADNRDD